MKIFRISLSLFLFGSAQNLSTADELGVPPSYHDQSKEDTNTGYRYIIKYKEGSNEIQKRMNVSSNKQNLRVSNSNERLVDGQFLPKDNAEVMILSSPEEAEALQENDEVEYVEKDFKRYIMAEYTPYGIGKVNALDVSDEFVAKRKVCIIDSGYDFKHPDLSSDTSVVTGYTGRYSTTSWNSDENGHGTHVAGTIAAIGGNDVGVVGVNRNGRLKMHIVKVFGDGGFWVWGSNLITAVEACVTSGSNIVNMSLGGGGYSALENAAYKRIFNDENVLLVAAAGNAGNGAYSYPASYDGVMSVAATDSNNNIAPFSQSNDKVDIAAPGVQVVSTVPSGGYGIKSGTSMATPHVSGVAALVWSLFPDKNAVEIRTVLEDSALDLGSLGRDNAYGHGLVDATKAVQFLSRTSTPPKVPNTPTSSPVALPANIPVIPPTNSPAPGTNGQSCDPSQPCASGLVCLVGTQKDPNPNPKCTDGAVNSQCNVDGDCVANRCEGSSRPYYCKAKLSERSECDENSDCSSNKCWCKYWFCWYDVRECS